MFKNNRITKSSKTKELKPKDGHNRFAFQGKVLYYKEGEIKETERDFSGMSAPVGKAYANDDDGNRYVVKFIFMKKWFPIFISNTNQIY